MKRWLLVAFALFSFVAQAADKPNAYAVASAHPLATQAGIEVLQAGGNAFDAAVAVSAALAVVEPTGSGLGGGGFWLLHRESDGLERFIDGREAAPLKASSSMYLDEQGKAVDKRSRDGALAGAIPGEPAALAHLSKTYGQLPLAQALAPAIRYARDGFACDDKLAKAFVTEWPRLSWAAKKAFAVNGQPPKAGTRIVQPDLVKTLERLAKSGRDGFYRGETAQLLVKGVTAGGGIWSADDLARYQVQERDPVQFWFRGWRITTAPPPSAGGVTLGETLNQLERLGWTGEGVLAKHLVIESLRRAYRDRARWLGDPDFVHVPVTQLLSQSYAADLAANISPTRATASKDLPPSPNVPEGPHTTHFSVLDAEGNRVAATLSINLSFGSGFMAPGTGIFVNDEMDDFAASATASNAYGLIGSTANLVAPGKRPVSSMSPSFVEGPRGLLILGTPGGSRIITMVLEGILGWVNGQNVQQIVAAPRFHHQYLPDEVQYEPGAFTAEEVAALTKLGHTLKPLTATYGNLQAVSWDPKTGVVQAASDPRGVGQATVVEQNKVPVTAATP